MKKKIIINLSFAAILLSSVTSCAPEYKDAFINGVNIDQYCIVYSETDFDYSYHAAQYLQTQFKTYTGVDVEIVEDSLPVAKDYEIVIGNTNREISTLTNIELNGLEFAFNVSDNQIALKSNYFAISAAAYYLFNEFNTNDWNIALTNGVSKHEPIVKDAKNFILLIGDGMGVNHTKLLQSQLYDINFSDDETIFYGQMLPYQGYARTDSLSGTTDSAAAGTALSAGTKTENGKVGLDRNGREVKLITELMLEHNKSAGVMSTEVSTGATPSAFSAHALDRDLTEEITNDQQRFIERGGVINCNFDFYGKQGIEQIEEKVLDTLDLLDNNENGFFLMYEEAHIDKHSHNNDLLNTTYAVARFNQVIARFMEYCFYNPDTFLLITADHETGGLKPYDEDFYIFSTGSHTSANVPVYAYGDGGQLFNRRSIENIQIALTIASFIGVTDFGNQTAYQYLK